MSIYKEEKQQIEEILNSLDVDDLSRSHNSVNISFAQMLAYIDKLQAADYPREITLLLQTYRAMAEKFYIQFELSLLREIERQHNDQNRSTQVIEKIKNWTDVGTEELETATRLLSHANAAAGSEYTDLVKDFPALLQTVLDKLNSEWQRLNTIAVSNQELNKDEELLRALEAVVKAAAYSVGIEKDRIVIVPGNDFALYFFSYLDNFAVLTVPIHSVRAPWEWSIFWHELAGYRVRQLENKTKIDEIKVKLKKFHNQYKNNDKQQELQKLLEAISRNNLEAKEYFDERKNKFGQRYLGDLFSRKNLVLSDLGSFEYQFEQMLENLKMKDKFQAYERIKAQGWCVDWFEELFEDAFSVLAIREPFLDFFNDVLSRHVAADGRHPPLTVRLNVANELLRLMNSEGEVEPPASVEESAAQQILKFITLLLVASHQLEEKDDYNQNIGRNFMRYNLPEAVGREIGTSIKKWSANFLKAKDRVKDARLEAEEFIKKFSIEDLEFISIFEKNDAKNEITPSYEKLLKGRNYKELLNLSFFERDFFTGLDISNVERFMKKPGFVSPTWVPVFSNINSTKIINGLMQTSGDIEFKVNGTPYFTTVINWNNIFPINDQYHISP